MIQKYDQLWFCLVFNASDICVCPNKVVSLLFPVIWHLALFPVRCVHVCHNKVLTSGYVLLLSESKIDGKWRHIPRLIFESKQVNCKQPFPAWNSFQYYNQLLGQITIKVLNSSVSKGYLQYIHIMPTLNANTLLVFSSPTKPNSLLLKDERWAPIYHQICVSLWSAAAE